MNFTQACKAKFKRGAKEHKQKWDRRHIDAPKEIRDELCDLANYSFLLKDQVAASVLRVFSEFYWNLLKND